MVEETRLEHCETPTIYLHDYSVDVEEKRQEMVR